MATKQSSRETTPSDSREEKSSRSNKANSPDNAPTATADHPQYHHSSSSSMTRAEQDIEEGRTGILESAQKQDEKADVIWVEFPKGDPENPFNFSRARKWTITLLAVFFTTEVAASASAYVPGIEQMERDLNETNHELSLLGISIYALGFGIPPLVLAPFSEVFGRRNVYLASHALYTIFFLCCGFAQNMTTMLIGRFFQGAFGSTGSTLVGGTLSDIWKSRDRGSPMALFASAAIFGTGIGPVWAGWVAQREDLGWRWIQWIQAIFTGAGLIVIVLCLDETRGSVILTRRAAKLRKETGDARYKARAEEERASLYVIISQSLTRPIWLLFSEPIVTAFSLWVSLNWLMLYATLESVGLVTDLHGYSEGQSGLVFLSICLAAVLGNVSNNLIQEKLYARYAPTKGPEARLYLSMVSALLFPIGCFIYGWTSYSHVSIAGPIVGLVVIMFGVYHVYLAVFNYLADSYLIFASSALAAQSFSRNM